MSYVKVRIQSGFIYRDGKLKSLGIHDSIEIIPEKTGEHADGVILRNFELAESKRQELKADDNSTYTEDDRFVIVFDLDIFE